MKIITYLEENKICVGVVQEDKIIDISDEFPNVLTIIDQGDEAIQRIRSKLASKTHFRSFEKKNLLSPIPKLRRNIICVGWNYLKHFEERTRQDINLPDKPTVFTKATESIAGPYEEIPYSTKFTSQFDYEAELAIVIGKKGKQVSEEKAMDYIFGYACANDLSARDVQNAHGGQWFLGKSMDKSCPLGPWIVTKDEIEDIQNLDISCKVNGDVVQSSNTSLMIFPIRQIVSEISKGMTLMPGDIILTGTPSGIGAKRNPPLLLKQGDVVEVSISKIGSIKNLIVEQKV
ncbi:hypothetical protein CD30_12910 [Ureibacillus massiliensis 4400831 = CIP 108448 = CCUG 49529]|uniref:Fumarylacetoacetase-like C-terminal domain-containing protein n=1 Tax=Ureibacillus massiliensis 4400831 = CIP 108448 = CCUG 49529 TaxID=1211035 RepID=A0A0A3J368_9BACL|nr:fumarylacetoacetate hydrolase family protein [Ureibacillus massiliensis]KGR90150.1 hypothetical protein CD30_12910 [Ureibacillus massiliensis 4400831 = CIP 108448 = CCUG 49529]